MFLIPILRSLRKILSELFSSWMGGEGAEGPSDVSTLIQVV
jgi:hypothetical protein